jgi:hypothetical protein
MSEVGPSAENPKTTKSKIKLGSIKIAKESARLSINKMNRCKLKKTAATERTIVDMSAPTGASFIISTAICNLTSSESAGSVAEIFFGDLILWKITAEAVKSGGDAKRISISIFSYETKDRDGGQHVCTFTYSSEPGSRDNSSEITGNLIMNMGAIMHVAPKGSDLEKFPTNAMEIRYPNGTLRSQSFKCKCADGTIGGETEKKVGDAKKKGEKTGKKTGDAKKKNEKTEKKIDDSEKKGGEAEKKVDDAEKKNEKTEKTIAERKIGGADKTIAERKIGGVEKTIAERKIG